MFTGDFRVLGEAFKLLDALNLLFDCGGSREYRARSRHTQVVKKRRVLP
jgi:hypothetical protein